MRNLPSLNALRTFEAAARIGNFTDAARELFVSQGAVSRAVAGLESWLEVPLFDRDGKRVALTEAGRAYREEIGAALDRMSLATARLTAARGGGRLRIDALPTLAMRWLIPRLSRFQSRHPGVELQVSSSDRPILRAGDFDLAIRRGPQRWSGLRATRILDERATPVCAPRFAAKHKLARPADLAKATLLHADPRPDAWLEWLRAQGLARLKPAGNLRFDHFYLTLQAAHDGLGVAMGPLPIIEEDLASGRLIAPFRGLEVPARSYYALVPTRGALPVARALVEFLQSPDVTP